MKQIEHACMCERKRRVQKGKGPCERKCSCDCGARVTRVARVTRATAVVNHRFVRRTCSHANRLKTCLLFAVQLCSHCSLDRVRTVRGSVRLFVCEQDCEHVCLRHVRANVFAREQVVNAFHCSRANGFFMFSQTCSLANRL